MMTVRKRVEPLPTHRLAVRHSVDYSSSDHFSLDDSSSSLSSSSSSETSSDFSTDALSDSASSRSSSDHSLPVSPSGTRPNHHLCSLVPSIHHSSTDSKRPSHDSSSVSQSSRKRIHEVSKPSKYRGTELEMDDDVVRSDGIDIDHKIQEDIDECIAYADALIDRGIDARVIVKVVDQEEIEIGTRGPVEVRVNSVTHLVIADDIPKPGQEERAVKVTYKTMEDLVQRFHDHTEEILVYRVQAIESVQRDQGYRIIATRQTREGVNEQIDRRLAGALGARDAARNLEPLIRDGGEQGKVNGNGRNGNGEK
ncbi:hypothetical protein Tco_1514560 [Tanacetum coccineum]